MQKNLTQRAKELNKRHVHIRWWHRVLSLLIAVVVFCTTYAMILPAITLTRELICGLEEHVHTEDCFAEQPVLTCELPESEMHTHTEDCYTLQRVAVCGLEECAPHTHTEACYELQPVAVCRKEAHTHSVECYAPIASDPEADVETEEEWKQSFASVELSGDWSADVVAITKTQLGYRESSRNYQQADGDTLNGYTRYGA